jgi:hypothetical protein
MASKDKRISKAAAEAARIAAENAAAEAAAAALAITGRVAANEAARVAVWVEGEANTVASGNIRVAGIRVTVTAGPTEKAELQRNWPSKYADEVAAGVAASQYNLGHMAAQVIGEQATLDLIAETVALGGKAFQAVMAALRAVKDAGALRAKAGNRELATGPDAEPIHKAAIDAAQAEVNKLRAAGRVPKAPKAPPVATPAAQDPATPPVSPAVAAQVAAATPAEMVTAFITLHAAMRNATPPEGRGTPWFNALADMARAQENLQLAVKK